MKSPLCLSLLLLAGMLAHSGPDSRVPFIYDFHAEACTLRSSNLITWHPEVVECPVCNTKNVFLKWGSYGNYIYQDPSKYQLVFWPYTDSPGWYSCKNCRYSTFMEDFNNPPKEKLDELRKMLKDLSLPAQKTRSEKESMEHPPYLEIPTADRMLAAEKVYRTLGLTSDQFWDHFYRVLGYQLDVADRKQAADEARRKSLALIEKMLADKTKQPRKELLYIAGAMKHFLREDLGALKFFEEAKGTAYAQKDLSPEHLKNADAYLSQLIDEYIDMIKKGKGPRVSSDKE